MHDLSGDVRLCGRFCMASGTEDLNAMALVRTLRWTLYILRELGQTS